MIILQTIEGEQVEIKTTEDVENLHAEGKLSDEHKERLIESLSSIQLD